MKSKIYTRGKLVKIIAKLKTQGKKIGITNGVFDILHAGHIDYLTKAKNKCDVLIVSINANESVHQYKDPGRPVNSEKDRASVVAALSCVDYVTFHSERRMRGTLIAFKPDFYIKAGDYDISQLTSRDVLKEWGGTAIIIPAVKGKSTTSIINKIAALYSQPVQLEINPKKKSKAVFLDRDGVINEEVEYLHEVEKFKFTKRALEGIKKMQDKGYKIVIITNQAGIGLGYFTIEDFFKVNKKMLQSFFERGIMVSKVYFCPHSLEDNCDCRKPKTALFKRAQKDLNIDFKKSFVIGDMERDIEVGKKIEAKTILVLTGHGKEVELPKAKPDYTAENLYEAASFVK